jgi:hypothetical protein
MPYINYPKIVGSLEITENANVSGDMIVGGKAVIGGDSIMSGKTLMSGTVDILGNINLNGNIHMSDVSNININSNLNMNNNTITNLSNPVYNTDAVSKKYMTEYINEITDDISLLIYEISDNMVVDISELDVENIQFKDYLRQSNGKFIVDQSGNVNIGGTLDMCGNIIKSIAEPIDSSDAVPKEYMEQFVIGKIEDLSQAIVDICNGIVFDISELDVDNIQFKDYLRQSNGKFIVDQSGTLIGNTFFVDSSNGNIGINTMSPTEKLHINNQTRIGNWIIDGTNGLYIKKITDESLYTTKNYISIPSDAERVTLYGLSVLSEIIGNNFYFNSNGLTCEDLSDNMNIFAGIPNAGSGSTTKNKKHSISFVLGDPSYNNNQPERYIYPLFMDQYNKSGIVGINNRNPLHALDISGNCSVRNSLTVGDTNIIPGYTLNVNGYIKGNVIPSQIIQTEFTNSSEFTDLYTISSGGTSGTHPANINTSNINTTVILTDQRLNDLVLPVSAKINNSTIRITGDSYSGMNTMRFSLRVKESSIFKPFYLQNLTGNFINNKTAVLPTIEIGYDDNTSDTITANSFNQININALPKLIDTITISFTISSGFSNQYLDITNFDFTFDVSKLITNFTGQHHNYSVTNDINENLKGFTVVATGNYRNSIYDYNDCIASNITINESLPVVDLSKKSYDKRVFGVISDKDDTTNIREQKNGAFVTSIEVFSEDRPLTINSLGEGAIWVCNVNGIIENGDYLVSSPIPGISMKQSDDLLHNYTVAKSTMDCNFSKEVTPLHKLELIEDDTNKLIPQLDNNGELVFTDIKDENGLNIMMDKYQLKWINVFEDKYIIYNNVSQTDVFYTYNFNFKHGTEYQQTLIGKQYVLAFIGCTYHCG